MKKLFIYSIVALTACGGSSSNDGSNNSANAIPSNIVGVWDSSTDEGAQGVDEAYVAINADGNVFSYDYAGDTFDNWGNCYWIAENSIQLKSRGGSKYLSTITFPNLPSISQEVELTVSGNVLTVVGKDVDDEDGDGNTTEIRVDTMTRSTRAVASFTPHCTDSFSVARSQIPAKKPKASAFLPLN